MGDPGLTALETLTNAASQTLSYVKADFGSLVASPVNAVILQTLTIAQDSSLGCYFSAPGTAPLAVPPAMTSLAADAPILGTSLFACDPPGSNCIAPGGTMATDTHDALPPGAYDVTCVVVQPDPVNKNKTLGFPGVGVDGTTFSFQVSEL